MKDFDHFDESFGSAGMDFRKGDGEEGSLPSARRSEQSTPMSRPHHEKKPQFNEQVFYSLQTPLGL